MESTPGISLETEELTDEGKRFDMKTLIVYYSYTQNTKGIAQRIQRKLGCAMAEIRTATPYAGDYDAVVEQGQREVDAGFCPPIQPLDVDLGGYDRIVLGTPVWWYTMAPAVLTFLTENDLAGKTVVPFMTNGGWLGHTRKDIARLCRGADVEQGIDIKFDGNKLATAERELSRWIDSLKSE